MSIKRAILLTLLNLLCLIASISIIGQPGNLHFHHYNVDNGLPQNSVNTIMQDRQGFIWVGTQDGLCRFDGYSFKTYNHSPTQKNSLSNAYVWHILQDNSGIIWVATFGGGVNRFDPNTETFTHYKWDKDDPTSISSNNTFYLCDGGDCLWVGTNNGFCKLDKETGRAQRFRTNERLSDDIAALYFGQIVYKEPGVLWLVSDSGLFQFEESKEKLTKLINGKTENNVDFSRITYLQKYGEDVYATTPKGVIHTNPNKSPYYLVESSDLMNGENPGLLGILPISADKYWINSSNGLIWFDSKNKKTSIYKHNPSNATSLSHDNVLFLFRSKADVLWIGTRGGLDKVDRENARFKLLTREVGKENTLSHAQISGIAEDKYGRLWLGTPNGVNVYDRENDSFYLFNSFSKNSQKLSANYVLDVHCDDSGRFWVGTKGGGLNIIVPDPVSKNLEKAKVKQYLLENASIQSICKAGENKMWLGTSGRNLYLFDTNTGQTINYPWKRDGTGPSHPYIFYVFVDSFENIWLGTATGGINLFDPVSERFVYIRNVEDNPNSLSNNLILSFFEDDDHQLWVGTTGGLNKLTFPLKEDLFNYFKDSVDLEKDSLFTIYNRASGLPNDLIYGVLQDDRGDLWISTNRGIVRFDSSPEEPDVKTWDVSDGLQSNEFNQNAFFKNRDGEMFFGGIGGVNIFHPDSIRDNEHLPPVYLTEFKLFNKRVPLVSENTNAEFVLHKPMNMNDRIELDHFHNVLTFDFAALNYINQGKNRYRYFMEGFNVDWVDAGTERSATYTNLDAGNYTFYVQGSNDDGVWSNLKAKVNIIVNPPPWLSWYAYLIYFILGILALSFIIKQRIKAATRHLETKALVEKTRAETKEEFRIKTSQDFHDESGNKITKINLFAELAKKEVDDKPELKNYLDRISKNTRELAVGMRDFIWALDPEKDTLYDTLLRLQEFGETIFTDTGIPFQIDGLSEGFDEIKLNMDTRRAIMLIFKEAMNNCAKYAKAKHVILKVDTKGEKYTLSLVDDGKGFNPKNMKIHGGGYGIKNMRSRAEKIGATLDVISKTGEGTSISVNMEIPHLGY